VKNKALYHIIAVFPLALIIITASLTPSFHNSAFLFSGLGVAGGIWMGTLEALPLIFWLDKIFFRR